MAKIFRFQRNGTTDKAVRSKRRSNAMHSPRRNQARPNGAGSSGGAPAFICAFFLWRLQAACLLELALFYGPVISMDPAVSLATWVKKSASWELIGRRTSALNKPRTGNPVKSAGA